MYNNGFPYFIDNLTIRNNSTLFIENGCELYLTTSSVIMVGYSSSSKGNIIANKTLFKGTSYSDSKIYIKESGYGIFDNCIFNNSYLLIENSNAKISSCVFKAVINR